ncbi:MAG: bifunctional 4-hydroxy-2-oxoglutarate aldolase/2-dehydro-3-deoxy-phosphogluconate aldolase [Alphaproteobacteria bacterium]|nr:bifunctional 4-hydroxy-2-oxoglutarate aldolase/2-dehydro-3-deoxy-phosphogluconate aldolase [Alphaproteobacteria bacterium]
MNIDIIMRLAPVIPVLVVDDVAHARPLAQALVAGGLPVLEVTLRTPAALDVIRAMAEVPGAVVGAGTVLSPQDLDQAVAAGARFVVSPGLTPTLAGAARASGVPFLPGVATATDIIAALEQGFSRLKYFPATANGGLPALKAMAAVFGGVRFCPTGGITEASAPDWLAEPAVVCVGGSWLAKRGESDWPAITARARAAAALNRAA